MSCAYAFDISCAHAHPSSSVRALSCKSTALHCTILGNIISSSTLLIAFSPIAAFFRSFLADRALSRLSFLYAAFFSASPNFFQSSGVYL